MNKDAAADKAQKQITLGGSSLLGGFRFNSNGMYGPIENQVPGMACHHLSTVLYRVEVHVRAVSRAILISKWSSPMHQFRSAHARCRQNEDEMALPLVHYARSEGITRAEPRGRGWNGAHGA